MVWGYLPLNTLELVTRTFRNSPRCVHLWFVYSHCYIVSSHTKNFKNPFTVNGQLGCFHLGSFTSGGAIKSYICLLVYIYTICPAFLLGCLKGKMLHCRECKYLALVDTDKPVSPLCQMVLPNCTLTVIYETYRYFPFLLV